MISLCENGHDQVAYYGDVCPACHMAVKVTESDQEASVALAAIAESAREIMDLEEKVLQHEIMISALENKIQQLS